LTKDKPNLQCKATAVFKLRTVLIMQSTKSLCKFTLIWKVLFDPW